jgi:hypothetical protein
LAGRKQKDFSDWRLGLSLSVGRFGSGKDRKEIGKEKEQGFGPEKK